MKNLVRYFGLSTTVLLLSCSSQEIGFYIDGAELEKIKTHQLNRSKPSEKIDFSKDDDFLVTGHRIINGKGLILADRSKKGMDKLDGTVVEKLTIYIKGKIPKYPYTLEINNNQFVGFYSAYGVTPDINKAGCFGYVNQGKIIIDKIKEGTLKVLFDVVIDTRYIVEPSKKCSDVKINKTVLYNRKQYNQISPWEGKPSTDTKSETFNL